MLRTELIRPLPELLEEHARTRGSKVAFRDDSRRVTYAELTERTARLAGHLRDLGLEHGDRVMLYLDNSVDTVESYLAILRAGGVGVCINPDAAETQACFMAADSGARGVITDAGHAERAATFREVTSLEWIITTGRTGPAPQAASYEQLLDQAPGHPPADSLSLDEAAWMLYTSGTTGRPKGVLLSQRNLLWVTAACWAPITNLSEHDVVLSPLPLFHSYALALSVVAVAAVGAEEHVLPRFSTTAVLDRLRDDPVTVLPGVPTMFHYLLQGAGSNRLPAPRLRCCISAGAIMPATLNREFEERFGVQLLDGYGITETATMVTMNWPTGTRIMGSCGLPLPGSEVRVVDPATGVDQPPGRDGELWVAGPHVMLGYHGRPEQTGEVLRNGWYHTGDLGHRDEHGYLTISGRIKELIIRGGENIYPAEVEEVLLTHPGLSDAAVIGRPDEALGEVPVAFVVAGDSFDVEALEAHCRDHLTPPMVPAAFYRTDRIPRTGSGKTMRHVLSQQLPTETDR